MKLGKTKDSRIRKKQKQPENLTATERLKEILSTQKEFTQYLIAKGYSNSTTRRYVKDAEMFIQWAKQENVPLTQVTYTDVLHYIQTKRTKVKQRTVSTNINSIKHYFNYLAITNQTLQNPTTQIQIKGIKRKTLHHIFKKEELEQLYNNYPIPSEDSKHKNQNWFKTSVLASKRNKVILGLIIYQGLTTTELSRLEVKDVKLREGKIYIAGTRRSNERTLALEAHQILDIMAYTLQTRQELLQLTKKQTEVLFISAGESPHFRSIISKLLQKLKAQNSSITSVQQLRTSVITHWLKIYNLRQVQYMAGHRYVSSTEAYLVNDLEDLQEDITKFHPIG